MPAKGGRVGLSEPRGKRHGAAAGYLINEGVLADGELAVVNGYNQASTEAGRLRAMGFQLSSSWPCLHCLGIWRFAFEAC